MKKFWRKGPTDLDNKLTWQIVPSVDQFKMYKGVAKEGDIILAQVGVVKRREPAKKAKPFKVGLVYDRMNSSYQAVRIIAKTPEGQLIGENLTTNVLNRFNAEGVAVLDAANREVGNRAFDLIPEYEDVPGELYIEEVKD